LWADVVVNVTFKFDDTHPPMVMPAFWDGGSTWRVRFSPPTAGAWTYVTACNDLTDAGLHGVKGRFTAEEYTGNNPLYRHGILRPSKNNRFLEHADGTPFYWLGDTHWSGFSRAERFNSTNNGTGSMFKEMVNARVQQGYSVWKAETFAVNAAESWNAPINDGGPAWFDAAPGLTQLNPRFWADIDRRVAYVASQGMVISLAYAGIGRGMPDATKEPAMLDLARYAVARHAFSFCFAPAICRARDATIEPHVVCAP
jgi:hypothetical protein